jgi:DNA-binding NarL/FixJ family response regulator
MDGPTHASRANRQTRRHADAVPSPIRVLIVDDQEMVRAGLRLILSRRPDMLVVGEAADGLAAVTAASQARPDVILMDIRMPGIDGVEAIRQIHARWKHPKPPPRILVLTTFDLDEYVYAALRQGATGFLLKNCTPTQLTEAIRLTNLGDAVLAPTVTGRLIRRFAATPPSPQPDPSRIADLTAREQEVLVLVAQGLSNSQIAKCLELTETNVKSRVNRILTRLGLDNRVQAAIAAYSSGLLPSP